jgi:hypothetical protein
MILPWSSQRAWSRICRNRKSTASITIWIKTACGLLKVSETRTLSTKKYVLECVCVYSDNLEAMERLLGLVPDGKLRIALKNYHDASTCIRAIEMDVVACFADAETGVLLADALSEALEVSTNGTAQSLERRS